MPNLRIEEEHLILVEGRSDQAFFLQLLTERGIRGFQVLCPWDLKPGLGGDAAIGQLLNGLTAPREFAFVKHIVLVFDSDADVGEKLEMAQEILRNTIPFGDPPTKFPVPNESYSTANAANAPAISIVLLPSATRRGAMEGLCWDAGKVGNLATEQCIDQFASCVGADQWPPQKLDKFRLRCLITANRHQNPDLPTSRLWIDMPGLVPVVSPVFSPISDYLSGLLAS